MTCSSTPAFKRGAYSNSGQRRRFDRLVEGSVRPELSPICHQRGDPWERRHPRHDVWLRDQADPVRRGRSACGQQDTECRSPDALHEQLARRPIVRGTQFRPGNELQRPQRRHSPLKHGHGSLYPLAGTPRTRAISLHKPPLSWPMSTSPRNPTKSPQTRRCWPNSASIPPASSHSMHYTAKKIVRMRSQGQSHPDRPGQRQSAHSAPALPRCRRRQQADHCGLQPHPRPQPRRASRCQRLRLGQ
jgi:hypothetical protein